MGTPEQLAHPNPLGRRGGDASKSEQNPSRLAPAILFLALCVRVAAPSTAQCSSVKPISNPRGVVGGFADSVGLLFDDPTLAPVVQEAVHSWSRCRNYGTGFPAFRVSERGTRTIHIQYIRGSKGLTRTCGTFRGDTITLYATTVGPRGRRLPCGSVADNLAHELGHVLGLRDCPDLRACDYHVMTYIELGINREGRSVQPEECQLVGQRWLTTAEHRRASDSLAAEEARVTAAGRPPLEEDRPR